jgi:choline dehydrogenase-like flavoprotein
MKPMREEMKRYSGPVDVCIVGAGAAGSTLAKELSEGGLSVVVIEAGPWLDTQKDFKNDELATLGMFDWDDTRLSDGQDPIKIGRQNTGRAIGGSTVHFTAMKLRLHPDDFQLRTLEGIANDWPFTYEELEPYYDKVEHFLGVSGPRDMPWPGFSAPYPMPELPMSAGDEVIAEGFERLGIQWRMTPHAIITGAKEGRSPCMFYGFCVQGCKSDAKGSALVTWVPHAVKAGAEFRENCFVTRINVDSAGLAKSVTYLFEGKEYEQAASVVIVSGYSIETPRLLFNSACPQFPNGLANSSGLVGKNLMVHPGADVYGHFSEPLDNFITPPVGIMTQDGYGTRRGRSYPRGYTLNRYAHFPIEFITGLLKGNPDLWGPSMFEVMDEYPYWTNLTSLNEMLPRESNQVTLGDEKDQNGLPVARVTMSYSDDDRAMMEDVMETCEVVLKAGGADRTLRTKGDYHLLGTCRMGTDPARSVVSPDCRSHDIPNLYICDGSVFVTGGAVNPSLTIEAIAMRTAEKLLQTDPAELKGRYLA